IRGLGGGRVAPYGTAAGWWTRRTDGRRLLRRGLASFRRRALVYRRAAGYGLAPTGRTRELSRCAAIPVSVLVVDRAHHVDGRVTTLPVVDGFDPVNRLGSCASPRRP